MAQEKTDLCTQQQECPQDDPEAEGGLCQLCGRSPAPGAPAGAFWKMLLFPPPTAVA